MIRAIKLMQLLVAALVLLSPVSASAVIPWKLLGYTAYPAYDPNVTYKTF